MVELVDGSKNSVEYCENVLAIHQAPERNKNCLAKRDNKHHL
jgi:hypothetical protein